MAYACNHCGEIFSEPAERKHTEQHTEFLPFVEYEYWYEQVCPNCGSDEYEEAGTCAGCEEDFRMDDLIGGYYCKDCLTRYMTPITLKAFAEDNQEYFAEWIHDVFRNTGKPDTEK